MRRPAPRRRRRQHRPMPNFYNLLGDVLLFVVRWWKSTSGELRMALIILFYCVILPIAVWENHLFVVRFLAYFAIGLTVILNLKDREANLSWKILRSFLLFTAWVIAVEIVAYTWQSLGRQAVLFREACDAQLAIEAPQIIAKYGGSFPFTKPYYVNGLPVQIVSYSDLEENYWQTSDQHQQLVDIQKKYNPALCLMGEGPTTPTTPD